MRHLIFFVTVPRADVIFLQKTIFQPEFVRLAVFFKKLRALKIIFDIDDLARNKETKLLLKHASLTVTSSHFLVSLAKTLSPRVEFIPTSVAFELYKANEKKSYETETPVIGWIGTLGAHRENLALLPPVLGALVKEGLKFKFLLVADLLEPEIKKLFSEIPGLNFEMSLPKGNPGKDPALIPKIISGFDISLMPLEDTERNRAKAAFKLVESMAVGVASMGSRVGENVYLIQDGADGFLAGAQEEWVKNLRKLIADFELRRRLGRAGQETVRKRYSLEAVISQYENILWEFGVIKEVSRR